MPRGVHFNEEAFSVIQLVYLYGVDIYIIDLSAYNRRYIALPSEQLTVSSHQKPANLSKRIFRIPIFAKRIISLKVHIFLSSKKIR